MKRQFTVTVSGQKFDVTVVEKESSGAATGVAAQPAAQPAEKKVSTGSVTTGATSGQGKATKAPMSGKIMSVLVQEGDMVERGQPLLVLEAMKLENDIVAPQDGKIERVLVKAGQLVETGDELILIS